MTGGQKFNETLKNEFSLYESVVNMINISIFKMSQTTCQKYSVEHPNEIPITA